MDSKMVSGRSNSNNVSTQSPELEVVVFSADQIIAQLQEELELIRLDNKQCRNRVQQLETTVARMRSAAQCSKDERDLLKRKLRELQSRFASFTSPPTSRCDGVNASVAAEDGADHENMIATGQQAVPPTSPEDECRPPAPAIAPKIAERVRLKRFPTDQVFGSEISSLGVSDVRLAEHLAETVKSASQFQELYHSLSVTARQQEFEIELDNLRSQINRMKSQVAFLELTLNESRTLSENLNSLCSQLESNETALQLALLFDDYIEQGLGRLLELGDSRLAFVLASCQAVHCDNGEQQNYELLSLAKKETEKVEIEAKILLRRLEVETSGFTNLDLTPSHAGSSDNGKWCHSDEIRLRSLIEAMKTRRDAIRGSLVQVPSTSNVLKASSGGCDRGNSISRSLQEEKLALENVVLLQELTAIKDDKTQLKARLLVLEKENELLVLKIKEKDLYLGALKLSVVDSDEHQNFKQVATESVISAEQIHASQVATESSDIVVGQTVLPSNNLFEEVMAAQELRQNKSDYLIEYLKRINDSLLAKLQRSKRKQKAKLRRLQYALRYVSEQYELELSALRGRLVGASPAEVTTRDSGNETLCSNISEA